jgi:hypothetical protein
MTKKLFGAVLAFAMLATGVLAPVNHADAATYNFTRDLTIGSTGADVVQLQQFLVARGLLVMPAGVSYGYFGGLTQSALGRYQASVGISPTAGYFGPITRAHMNVMTIPGTGTPTTPDDDDDDDDELQGGEGDINDFDVLSSPNNEEISENDEVRVLGFEFEAEDSDLRVERVDVHVEQTNDTEIWDIVEEARLMHGDEEVASVTSLDDEDEWSDEDDDVYGIRFDDIDDGIVREGDTDRWYVEFVAVSNIDSADFGDSFEVYIPDDGVRAIDAEGIDIYAPTSDSESNTLTVEEQDGSEITVSESDDNPDSGIIVIDDEDETDDVDVLAFEIESEDSAFELNEIRVYATSSSSSVASLVSELILEIDGQEFDGDLVGSGTSVYYSFDIDGDVEIDEDDIAEAVVRASFNKQEGNYSASGESIMFAVEGNATSVQGESVSTGDDIEDDDISGTAEGNEMNLALSGVDVEVTSKDSQLITPNTGSPYVSHTFTFEVTAIEDTVYVPLTAGTGTEGFSFNVTAGSGTTNFTVDQLSDNTESNNRVRINAGQTAEFEVVVTFNPDSDQSYRAELDEVRFYEAAVGGTASIYEAPDTSEFKSSNTFVPGN